jgi:aminopeptidase
MSLVEYEDFVYGACHVRDGDDPIAHWESVSTELTARAAELQSVRELRIVGPDTDLRVGVEGRPWIPSDGRQNMPDGEVFTSPVETETEGDIYFAFPSIFQGQEVENVRLRFEGGRVVEAEATSGEDYLRSLIGTDDGSAVLGEVAFGLNYEIDRFTRDILFDEKIGGTMHVALGGGFDEAGTKNVSDLHWDLICDLRQEGEVYADGELVWKAGTFLTEAAVERV